MCLDQKNLVNVQYKKIYQLGDIVMFIIERTHLILAFNSNICMENKNKLQIWRVTVIIFVPWATNGASTIAFHFFRSRAAPCKLY